MPKTNPSVGRHAYLRMLEKKWQLLPIFRVATYICIAVFLLLIISGAALLHVPGTASAQTNDTLNFQARLLTSGGSIVPDGTYNVEFKLYDQETGGTALWTETREFNTDAANLHVDVKSGYLSVYLGDKTNFPGSIDWNDQHWLTMNIGGTTATPAYDGEMTPRIRLTSVPFAFAAEQANTATSLEDVQGTNTGTLAFDTLTTDRDILLPNATGTVALLQGDQTFTGAITFSAAGTALNVTNNADIGGTLDVGGNATFDGDLTVSAGSALINASSTLFTALSISDLASGGAIGTAAATVDIATTFNVNQTTSGQALTLPSPTNTTSGRIVYINNVGSETFTIYGSPITAGSSSSFIWNGSNWVQTISFTSTGVETIGTLDSQTKSADGAVVSGTALYLQTADATNPGLVSTAAQTFAGDKTFTGDVTVSGNAVFEAATNATTAFQVRTSTSGVVLNVDTINERVGIGTVTPQTALEVVGAYTGSQLSSPAAPTVVAQGTTGTTSWGYKVSATDGQGETLASTETTIADGNATLDGTNFNRVTWTATPGAVDYKIYRSTAAGTPSSTGLIGTIAATATLQLDDTGLAGTDAEPASNTTGGAYFNGRVRGLDAVNNDEFVTLGQANTNYQAAGDYFIQDGNAFGEAGVLGTTDTFGLDIQTDGTTRISISDTGNVALDTDTLFVDAGNNRVQVGSSSAIDARLSVIGGADQTQLLVRANATQSLDNPLVLLQDSAGSELARINATASSLYFGYEAGGSTASGANNIGIGASALGAVSTGTANTTLGSGALASVSIGSNNTAVGYNAGNLLTGSNNILLGYQAGDNLTTGSNNIIIGDDLDASAVGVSNELRIGGILQGDLSTLELTLNGAVIIDGETTLNDTLTVTAGIGIVGTFSGRVAGGDAVNNDEFVTLGQANTNYQAAGDYFTQNGNAFGEAGVLGTTDTFGLGFITDNVTRMTIAAGGDIDVVNALTVGTGLTVTTGGIDVTGDSTIDGTLSSLTGLSSSGNIDFASLNAGGMVYANATTGRLSVATAGTDYETPLTFDNGLTRTGDDIALGGTLTADTNIALDSNDLTITGGNVGIGTSGVPSSLLSVGGTTGNFTVDNAGAVTAVGVNAGTGLLQGTGGLDITGASSFDGSVDITGTVGIGTVTPQTALEVVGAYTGSQLSSPAAPTVVAQGTTGTTSWGYKVSATDGQGETLASTETTIADGNATLDGTNFNRITWTATPGAVDYKVYRSTAAGTPSSTGLIGTIAATATLQLDDTGLAGTDAEPASNTTGGAYFNGRVRGLDAVNNDEFVTLGQANTNYQAAGDYFIQDGNAFGEAGVLGTTDTFGLGFITDNVTRMTIAAGGDIDVVNALTVGTGLTVTTGGIDVTGASSFDGNVDITGTNTFTVGTGATSLGGNLTADGTVTLSGLNSVGVVQTDLNGELSTSDLNLQTGPITGTLQLANGGTGASDSQGAINNLSQFTTEGDLLFYNGTNSTRLARGNVGECLASTATTVEWLACSAGVSLQVVYENSTQPQIVLDATRNGLIVRDASTPISGDLLAVQNFAGDETYLGVSTAGILVTGDITLAEGADRTMQLESRSTNAAGNNLTVSAGSAGSGASAFVGGDLTLQGGDAAGTGNAVGGNILLNAGAGVGTGSDGQVIISTPSFKTIVETTCSVDCAISQSNVDNNAAVVVEATAENIFIEVPDPSITTAGRVVYIISADGSSDYELVLNEGEASEIVIAMQQNSTATLMWSGSNWTAAGASSSTTLQAAYNNTLTSAGGADIVLNNTATSAGLTIRNNADNPIIGSILEAQTSIGSNLFSVNNNAREFAIDGGAETAGATPTTFPANTWSATPDGGTVSRYNTIDDYVATGRGSVSVVTGATAGHGTANELSQALTPGLRYTVSYTVRGLTGFTTLDTLYSPDGTNTGTVDCETSSTVNVGTWRRVDCIFDAPISGITANNAIFIRQSDTTARTFYIDNLSVTISADVNHAADGDVDDPGEFTNNWVASPTGGTITRDQSIIYNTSASARADTSAVAGEGIQNNMAIEGQVDTQYLVTLYAQSTNTFDDIRVRYSRDGGTNFVPCDDYNTRDVSTTTWTRITCLFKTDGTAPTNAALIIDQETAVARSFWVDGLSITLNSDTASNVKIGGGSLGGPTTLLTLDRSAGPPVANNNEAYLGSMYYDTLTGRIQCYEEGGWGTCGSPPDNIVNLNPEYAGSVLNGGGVGTMTADFCANETGVLDINASLCGAGEALNYYRWTSPQATEQTYSIYVTYQLPSTFDGFSNDETVQLTARRDNSNAEVSYEMFRSQAGEITRCGTAETQVTTTDNSWQTVGINGNEATGCGFNAASANSYVIFKINLKANSNANAYTSTLSFTTTGR